MTDKGRPLRSDLTIGTLIGIAMAALFTLASPGRALIVTFVPGVVVAWLVFMRLGLAARAMPAADRMLPLFGLALAVQFLHFAEEYGTGFQVQFGPLYGGGVIGDRLFVAFNMAAYAVFLLSALGVAFLRRRFLLMPVLFFAVYGVVGNAVSHLLWVIVKGGYFPGLVTSLAYWLIGPLLLRSLGLGRTETAAVVIGLALVLLGTVGTTMDIAALRAG